MREPSLKTIRRLAVLDLETAPDPHATGLLQRPGSTVKPRGDKAAVHRIVAATVLRASECGEEWDILGIETAEGHTDFDERDMLRLIDEALVWVADGNGTLATFNGERHDLVILRRRAARHLMMGLSGIRGSRSIHHVDLMTGHMLAGGTWYSLREAAAGLGIPVEHRLSTKGIGMAKTAQKGQTDVAASFLLFLFELAMQRGDAGAVVNGWRALGDYVRSAGPHGDHLAQYRRHPLGGGSDV